MSSSRRPASNPSPSGLRQEAEARLEAQPSDPQAAPTDDQRLQHELAVFRLELEMQNEELRQSRAETQAALDRYTALYDLAPLGYFTFDRIGTIRQLNLAAAALLGGERAYLLERSFLGFVEAKDRPAFSAFVTRLFSRHQRESCELALSPPADSEAGMPCLIRIEAVPNEAGETMSAIAVDVTQTKRLIESLERSNLELQRFAYVAAHDLRTPLRSIMSFAQLLHQKYHTRFDTEADEWLDRLLKAACRMSDLTRDLLDYARVDSRGHRFAPTDMRQLVGEVISTLSEPIRETGAHVTSSDLPVVMADRTQLAQTLQNLLDNALKYRGHDRPDIHVSATRGHGEWVFAVRDNGIGIAPKHRARIFDLFQRLHTLQKYPGTGIGLAICRRVIERHGGKIWVESEPGKGSVFYFTLPDRAPSG